MVANLFTRLMVLNENARTLAIVTSDNGMSWGEHGITGKRTPYTPSVRIPLMVRWPDRITPGTSPRLASLVDIAPTVLEAAELPSASMDGRPLFSYPARGKTLLEHWRGAGIPNWASLRHGRWQYTEYYRHGKIHFREFYDLERDQYQLENVIHDDDPETGLTKRRLARLHELLLEARECQGAGCRRLGF